MPVSLTSLECEHPIGLNGWEVEDRECLVAALAHLALGRTSHVRKIIGDGTPGTMEYSSDAIDRAIASVFIGDLSPTDPIRIHRDGWLFQLISWIVSFRSHEGLLIKAPQPRKSDKGFDGLVVLLAAGQLEWMLICEDKATDDPRGTVRDEVWPDFQSLERGERDNELAAEAEMLLNQVPDLDPSEVTGRLGWLKDRRYRTSVATSQSRLPARVNTFEGYDGVVAGDSARRNANLFVTENLREFMQELSCDVIAHLESMRPA